MLQRVWARRYSRVGVRIGLGCALAAGTCLAVMGEGGGGAGAAPGFVPGTALAGAQAIQLSPTTGGLNYSITLATSLSQYENAAAAALSQTIDLGLIGTAVEADQCDGSPPVVDKKYVPQAVQAESINGNQTVNSTITPQSSGSGIGVGNELATVTTQPSGSSLTSVQNIVVPGGLLSVSGLASASHSSLDGGNLRMATATTNIAGLSLLGGAIQLGGLQWVATQESGAKTVSTATFTLGSLKVAGAMVPLTAATSPQTLLNVINMVGSPLGFNIQWPVSKTLPDGTIVITPLVIGIDNNVLGQKVIGANQGAIQPVRQAIVDALLKVSCKISVPITLADIDIGVLAGGGNLNVNLGGAHALTTDAAAISPFAPGATVGGGLPLGSLSLGSNGGGSSPVGSGVATLPRGSSVLGGGGTTPGTGGTSITGGGSGGRQPKVAIGPIQKTTACVSLSPAGGGCGGTNVAVPIGFIALGLVFLLAVWDFLRQRRRAQILSAQGGAE